MPDTPIRTTIHVPPDTEVEIVRPDCPCPQGQVCPDGGLFAAACPRRPHPEDA